MTEYPIPVTLKEAIGLLRCGGAGMLSVSLKSGNCTWYDWKKSTVPWAWLNTLAMIPGESGCHVPTCDPDGNKGFCSLHPKYTQGTVLWVQEPIRRPCKDNGNRFCYKADGAPVKDIGEVSGYDKRVRTMPSVWMNRCASRHTLMVTNVALRVVDTYFYFWDVYYIKLKTD